MVLEWMFISDTGEDSAHSFFRYPLRQSSLSWESHLENGLEVAICCQQPGKKPCRLINQVSWDTELFGSVEFYLEDGLEMAMHLWHLKWQATEGRDWKVIF